jgi:hypothetical protein
MFVRFVSGTDADNAFRLDGLFTAAWALRGAGELYDHESKWLEEVMNWFNEHLPCPPFRRKLCSGEWTPLAICWFRDDAGEPLLRIWDLVALVREHGTSVRLIKTDRPGKIVYADKYQVVAETPYWTRRA